ncbi:AraC family transcriptional regulator [Novosphingobium sp. M1R2S20]|uniref:Helix-turn-helix domain-containing protein n=1 Tax=Novosphingobium rhizovicinum TaxID=3228928 RepID=A0ABV3RCG6_9SPHN
MSVIKTDPGCDLGLIPLAAMDRRPFAGAIIQDEYDINAPWHHHDMHQLQYAFEGSMEVEDEHGRHLLPRSLAAWVPAGTRHRNSLHRIRSVSVLLMPSCVPNAGHGVRILRVSPLMRAMLAEAGRWPLAEPMNSTGRAFFAAFARLCREWIADCAPLTLPTSTDTVLNKALALVRADPAGCTLAEAIAVAGLSERTLRRRCQLHLGMGWDEYRRRARLLASLEPLTESDQSIAIIAAGVGFESQSAYARAFRHFTGQTPQAFRQTVRK